jgi:hypothetical protein
MRRKIENIVIPAKIQSRNRNTLPNQNNCNCFNGVLHKDGITRQTREDNYIIY